MSDLISFDDESANAASNASGTASNSIMDDFASLTFGDSATTQPTPSQPAPNTSGLPFDLFDTSKLSQPPSGSGAASLPPSLRPAASSGGNAASVGLDRVSSPLGDWGALQLPVNATPRNGTSTPGGTSSQPPSRQASKAKDPFEDLLS
jgi:hypothetical protein